jgi:hypothetical protein
MMERAPVWIVLTVQMLGDLASIRLPVPGYCSEPYAAAGCEEQIRATPPAQV